MHQFIDKNRRVWVVENPCTRAEKSANSIPPHHQHLHHGLECRQLGGFGRRRSHLGLIRHLSGGGTAGPTQAFRLRPRQLSLCHERSTYSGRRTGSRTATAPRPTQRIQASLAVLAARHCFRRYFLSTVIH